MARHSLVPALDDLSHADAEAGGLMTVEAGVEWGVLTPHHAVVVHGDGVAATHDRAVSLGQLHNLEALRGFGRRELDNGRGAEFGVHLRHLICH